jgi:hypothetical protein
MFLLIQRAFASDCPWRTTPHKRLETARIEADASSADFLILHHQRWPVQYRIK